MPDTPALEAVRAALAGRYRIERLLGEGGMATVYLAEDERHRRRVAVKVLRPELAQTIGVERFHREIEIAARLNHPHILPLLDSGTLDFGPGRAASAYYVMPFVEGESLRDRLLRERQLPVAEALRLAREVADALDHAHRHGVVHRDIKPENILLSEQHAVVADFGIARALDEAGAGSLTRTGQSIGTPTYMSPEQITGEHPIDGRTDLYALGCTLFEMLAGQAPWSGGSMTSVLARRLTEPPPRIRALVPAVPPAVEDALLKTLAREPAERFNTPAEFAAALERSGPTGFVVAQQRSRRVPLAIGAAVLVVAAIGLTQLVGVGHADAISSLAIVPRADSGTDTGIAYLAEGIQGEVADLLRRLPQLRVTAPTLVAQLRRQQAGLNDVQLGQQLKVGAVLSLDITRAGDSIRVSGELIKIPSGDFLGKLRFARLYSEIAAVQGTLARMITDSLRLQLTTDERASMERHPTSSAAAYDLYIRGRRFAQRAMPRGAREGPVLIDSARYYAREAIERDPDFAAAHGLLSIYYFVAAFRGWREPFAAIVDSAVRFGRVALARDSTLGDVWVNQISHAIYLADDWDAARAAVQAGLRLNPNDASLLQSAAVYMGEVEGRIDSAIVLSRRSVELEPFNQNLNSLGDLYMRARRYDSAIVALRRAIEVDPTVPGPWRRLITSYERTGRLAQAISARRALGETVDSVALLREGPAGYERARRAELTRRLDSLLAAFSLPYKLPDDTIPLPLREGGIAAIHAQLGEWTKAMDWVLREYERRPRRFRLYVTNPDFAGPPPSLRSDPRFLPLVRKEGLESLLPRRR